MSRVGTDVDGLSGGDHIEVNDSIVPPSVTIRGLETWKQDFGGMGRPGGSCTGSGWCSHPWRCPPVAQGSALCPGEPQSRQRTETHLGWCPAAASTAAVSLASDTHLSQIKRLQLACTLPLVPSPRADD